MILVISAQSKQAFIQIREKEDEEEKKEYEEWETQNKESLDREDNELWAGINRTSFSCTWTSSPFYKWDGKFSICKFK